MGDDLFWLGEHLPDLINRLMPRPASPTTIEITAEFLDRWQTLISGVLAVAAAGVTVYFLARQIEIESRRDRMSARRAETGARIRIAPALSPLSVYVDEAFLHWARQDRTALFPALPHASIETLMQVSIDVDDDTFQSIRELVQWAQVFEARVTGFLVQDTKPPVNWREVLVSDLMYLSCLINRLYKYGRDQVSSLPFEEPSAEEMMGAVPSILRLGFTMDDENKLKDEIENAIEAYYGGKQGKPLAGKVI